MEKTTFGFMKNRLFITGLVVGIIFSAVVAILIFSLYQPAPEKQMLKGTLLNWAPSVNDLGTIKWTGDTDSCGRYVGVEFYNDPTGSLIICRPEGRVTSGSEVRVHRIADGKPCGSSHGGIWVSPTKSDKIEVPK